MRASPATSPVPRDISATDLIATIRSGLEAAAITNVGFYFLKRSFEAMLLYSESGQPLTPDQCDEILRDVARSRPGIFEVSRRCGAQEYLRRGLKALAGLAIYAADTTIQRLQRHPDELADLRAYATIIRNDLESFEKYREINGRALQRGDGQLGALDAATRRVA